MIEISKQLSLGVCSRDLLKRGIREFPEVRVSFYIWIHFGVAQNLSNYTLKIHVFYYT